MWVTPFATFATIAKVEGFHQFFYFSFFFPYIQLFFPALFIYVCQGSRNQLRRRMQCAIVPLDGASSKNWRRPYLFAEQSSDLAGLIPEPLEGHLELQAAFLPIDSRIAALHAVDVREVSVFVAVVFLVVHDSHHTSVMIGFVMIVARIGEPESLSAAAGRHRCFAAVHLTICKISIVIGSVVY